MKRFLLASVLTLSAWSLQAADVATDNQASISVKTRTEFEVDLDDTTLYGLSASIPELALYYNLSPWQKVGSKPRTGSPMGFVTFDLDAVQLRYTNGAQKDYNSPSTQNTDFGFNDPADTQKPTKPGYFGPVYLPNMRSGIVWGDWTLQLATAGGFKFSNPWNHEYEYANAAIQADWATLDSRVQYRRGTVTQVLTDRKDETGYWSYDTADTPNDDLASILPSGPLVGLEYTGPQVAARFKGATRYSLKTLQTTPGSEQGLALGGDLAVSPAKPLTLTGSVAGRLGYKDLPDPELVAVGGKAALSLPVAKGLEFMPVVGYDLSAGISGIQKMAQEGSAAITLKWAGSEGWFFDYLKNRSGTVYPGVTLAYKVFDADLKSGADRLVQNLRFSLMEDQGNAGLLKGLGSEWVIEWLDLTGPANLSLSGYADWSFKSGPGKIIPWVRALWDNTSGGTGRRDSLAVDAGVKFDQIIPKVQFGATWESGDLIPGNPLSGNGVAKVYAEVSL